MNGTGHSLVDKETVPKVPVVSKLENCPHCGADEDDLILETNLIASPGEEPSQMDFVYCSCCGHLGDRDTWNDRPEKGGEEGE